MNNDATEAALGLLRLSPHNLLPPALVPLKRKQHTALSGLSDEHTSSTEAISCICGFVYDDGFSIACDDCSKWCHAACFDIVEGGVPEEWRCWECVPRPVDREKAIKLQKARQNMKQAPELGLDKQRRRTSPGVERKHRRASAAAIDGGGNPKRKRRSSINVSPQPPIEDEHVDIDEPWSHSYVPITNDIIPHQDTRDKLRRQAQHWRGVTALQSPSILSPYSTTPVRLTDESVPHTTIQPLPNSSFSHPTLSLNTNPSVRPPAYSMHTTAPVPSAHLITPYASTIIPSSAYLANPLNAYSHLGMPKPFVHLLGPPLDLTLDSRITGDKGRFVRSGCRPNAVLRPVLCPAAKNRRENSPPDDDSLTFGVFALRDLKANEEVVLGWEWDDGNAVHSLPALIESPHMFPRPCSNNTNSSHQLQHLRNQMTNILHALSSTFTTCACGSKATDCVLTQMAAFVDGEAQTPVDLGPLVGVERGFMTKEKVPWSGGMSGVEMVTEDVDVGGMVPEQRSNTLAPPVLTLSPATGSPSPRKSSWWKGKGRAVDYKDGEGESDSESSLASGQESGRLSRPPSKPSTRRRVTIDSSPLASGPRHRPSNHRPPQSSSDDEQGVVEDEDSEGKMPPKMRKRWIHRSLEALRGSKAMGSASPSGSVVSLGSVVNGGVGIAVGSGLGAGVGLGIRIGGESDSLNGTVGDGEAMVVDDLRPQTSTTPMYPHAMPAPDDPTTVSSLIPENPHNAHGDPQPSPSPSIPSISPSISFAKLSLLSPIVTPISSYYVPGPDPHWASPRPSTNGEDEAAAGPTEEGGDWKGDDPIAQPAATDVIADRSPRPWLDRLPTPEPEIDPSPPPSPHPQGPQSNQTKPPLDDSPHQEPRSDTPPMPQWTQPETDYPSIAPTTHPRPPSPPPPPQPPPKVKMSLKDFAMRKKKQREEEMAKNPSSPASAPSVLDSASPSVNGKHMEMLEDHEEAKHCPDRVDDCPPASSHDDVDRPPNPIHLTLGPAPASPRPLLPCRENGVHGGADGTLQAKVELIEAHIPSGLVAADISRFPPEPPPPPRNQDLKDGVSAKPLSYPQLTSPPAASPPAADDFRHHSRRASQEDGEIPGSSTPPKQKQLASFVPRSYTPPTQPRSFLAPMSPSVSTPPSSAPAQSRRPSQPPAAHPYRPQAQPQPQAMDARPLPSGPRALRRAGNPMARVSLPPQLIPRGPSADRERLDWDRDRWRIRGRGSGSASGPGWGR